MDKQEGNVFQAGGTPNPSGLKGPEASLGMADLETSNILLRRIEFARSV